MDKVTVFVLSCAFFGLSQPAHAVTPSSHAVAFVYHRFGDDRYPTTDTRAAQFKAELDWLAANDYHVWPLPRIVEYLQSGKDIPDHVVAITIDDAFQSAYLHAYPLLKTRGWPFTIFVSTDGVDSKQSDFMTWDELRDMAAHGGSFANHTADHGHLPFHLKGESDLAWADRIRTDIEKGESRLEAELGKDVNRSPKLFAYPYGEYSEDLVKLVNGMGYIAFGQQAGVMTAPLDPRALPRFPINEHYAAVSDFALRAASLPFPAKSITPWDPAVKANNPPRLEVALEHGAIPATALHCYQNGPEMDVHWLDADKTRFAIQAQKSLEVGRDRYNCTAYADGRYYWYSHMWLLAPSAE